MKGNRRVVVELRKKRELRKLDSREVRKERGVEARGDQEGKRGEE